MPKKGSAGFTLLELLIVLVILSILAVTAGINFRTLSEDQVLEKATGDIQSYIRLAQSNATSGVKCSSTTLAGNWSVYFTADKKKLQMNCSYVSGGSTQTVSNAKPELLLQDAIVSLISGSPCTDGPPFTISFSQLYGNLTFNTDTNCPEVTLTVQRVNSSSTKTIIITKGGSINEAP